MAVFDFNSTSKKHIKDMLREPWTYVRSRCIENAESIVFSIYIYIYKKKKSEIFHDFIYVSLFQSKGQNSLSNSESSSKLINYSCSVNYFKNQSADIKTRVFTLSHNISFVKITLGSD